MNTAEVIRKISKKAGIPDTETKKFFEIFLKQTSSMLKPGESVKIPGVGLFQLRVGQIENSTENAEQQFIYSNLIVFIGEDVQTSEREEIIFNVPADSGNEYYPIDSYFSLSIGKPIIPLKGVKTAEFFIPPSGPELRGLYESKVTRLLENTERISGGKETEIILLKHKINTTETESSSEELPVQSDFMKTREFENLSWDFGENLSQELDEEPEEIRPEPEVIEKVYGKIKDEIPHFEEEDFADEHPEEELFEEVIEEETEWMETEDKPESKTEEEPEGKSENESENLFGTESKIENMQELKDSDFEDIAIEETENMTYSGTEIVEEKNEESLPETVNKEELSLKNFQRVSSLTKEFNISVGEENEENIESEKSHPKITEVRGGFQKVRRTTAEFNFDFSSMKGLDDEERIGNNPEETKSISEGYRGYRKRGLIPSLIISAVVILALSAIIFLYFRLKNENYLPETSKPQTKVIERNYDVPVTYSNDSPNRVNTEAKGENSLKNENPSNTLLNSDQSEITESVNAQRIENYIYQYPEGIVVQVSSWKSKSIAVSEVNKYRNAGYKAFAEMSTIPGMGLYYRVRVGYFNSLNEAKIFANGNQ